MVHPECSRRSGPRLTRGSARHRKIQPELRRDLLRVAERVDPDLAERLKDELDEAVPAAVLEAHWRELVPDRAALGAFPRRDCIEAPTASELLTEDPLRLRNVTLEVARFTKDDRLVAESVLSLAEQLGIDPELAVDVVTHGLMDAARPGGGCKMSAPDPAVAARADEVVARVGRRGRGGQRPALVEDEFGNLIRADGEPAWVPDEEREPSAAEVKTELLRSMLLTPASLAALPPPAPLISGYLTRGSLAATYGRPGTAKSFVAISMALAVVTGTPWFGHDVHRGPVLYVAGEGTSGLAQRQRAWQDACDIDDLDGMFWLPCAVNLLQSDWSRGLAELAAELEVVLVIIDTLTRSMVGGDENKSGDMAQAIEAADVIRRLSGATVDLVHHTPKDGETLRGHSALEGAVDTAILIKRSEAIFTLTTEKQKDIPQLTRLFSSWSLVSGAAFRTSILPTSILPTPSDSSASSCRSETSLAVTLAAMGCRLPGCNHCPESLSDRSTEP